MKQLLNKPLLKIPLKYSFIYVFFATFLPKMYYAIFIEDTIKSTFLNKIISVLFIDPFPFMSILFTLLIVLLLFEFSKTAYVNFVGVIKICLIFLFFCFTLTYFCSNLFFYFFSDKFLSMHSGSQEEILLSFINPFSVLSFDPIGFYFSGPKNYFIICYNSGNTINLIVAILSSHVFILCMTFYYFSLYRIFKANSKSGLKSLIPILNNIKLLEIVKKPRFWIIFLCVPFVRLIPKYFINKELCLQYNKSNTVAIAMTTFPWIFYGAIAFDKKTK